jgi:hypothetical protein
VGGGEGIAEWAVYAGAGGYDLNIYSVACRGTFSFLADREDCGASGIYGADGGECGGGGSFFVFILWAAVVDGRVISRDITGAIADGLTGEGAAGRNDNISIKWNFMKF